MKLNRKFERNLIPSKLMPSDHICNSKLDHHWFRQWIVAWPVPSHYLNQYWNIVNWTLRNKFQWYINWNSNVFIQENVSKMANILSRPQCVKCQNDIPLYARISASTMMTKLISHITIELAFKQWTWETRHTHRARSWPFVWSHKCKYWKNGKCCFHKKM